MISVPPVAEHSESFGSFGSEPAQFNNPSGIALGSIYVLDSGNYRIQKFDDSYNHITSWGSIGTGDGEFQNPTAIAVDDTNNIIYVADAGNSQIHTFILLQSPPIISSFVADDPDDLDYVYSVYDTLTITFDSDTNTPGGDKVQRKPAVDKMFTFGESLGRAYSGKWIVPDTFVITIHSLNNASPPVIGITTITPTGTTPILSADETSVFSSTTSPALSGDFGITQ